MFIRGVIDHQVHDQLHSPPVGFLEQAVEILHGPEFFHDCPIIGNIIPVVVIGGRINRAHPDCVDAQVLQIIQMGGDPVQIPDPISV